MSGWIGSLGSSQIENWDICVREGLFASGANASINAKRGDEVFIWLAPAGLKARCVATTDAARVTSTIVLPWPPKKQGAYHASFGIEIVVELAEPPSERWQQIQAMTGATQSPQLFPRVPDTGLGALRGLFGAPTMNGIDYSFLPGPDADLFGQDHRHLANRAIAYRRGQRRFRDVLLRAYRGRCAVTGSPVTAVLEAAHISPYRGDHTNSVDNGLLLRADIHTLFDLDLLTVTPDFMVRVSQALTAAEYSALDGQPLRVPAGIQERPHPDVLTIHNARCLWLNKSA